MLTYTHPELKYPDCGVDLTAESMIDHCRRLNGTKPDIDWDQLPFSHT